MNGPGASGLCPGVIAMARKNPVLRELKKGEGRLVGPSGSYLIYREGQTPCSVACPAGVDVKAYVNLIADRKYEDAVRVVRQANPFPGICGRVCTHPCEAECGRKDIDSAVSIRSLKRFAADYELSRKNPTAQAERKFPHRIAVVGAGPAGLTAAFDLALEGFAVTVFDSAKEAGGLLSWGIPDFRLPKNIVRSEVRDIEALGVEFSLGTKVENPAGLLGKGYSAVILATGCQTATKAGIPGEDFPGVTDCLDFLRQASEGKISELEGNVIVVGGGNAALDSARTALRLGAKVTVAYRRSEEQMPADREEIEQAKQEGVDFRFLAIPSEIVAGKGRGTSFRFQAAKLGEPDGTGRRSPVPVPNDYFELKCDRVIMAIGSKPDAGRIEGLKLERSGAVAAGEDGMTSVQGMFACGDITTGPLTIIDAIGGGHRAAAGVTAYLIGEPAPKTPSEMLVIESAKPSESGRCEACLIPTEKRQSTFDEVELGMDERVAITEALRCRRCGSCDVCDVCLAVCDYRNAMVSVPETGESAIAKVPFGVAAQAMDSPGGWSIESGKSLSGARIEPLLARVDRTLCIACGRCEEACPYKAIRTVFDAEGNASAVVDETACRGCGACMAACPAGAMAMGHLDDAQVLGAIRKAVSQSHENAGIVRFSCMWNRRNLREGTWPWEVRVQCTRRLSPAIFIETLALGARAISVLGCGEEDCHYVPGPWMGPDVVESSRDILEAIGVNPGRIAYIDSLESVDFFFSAINSLREFENCSARYPETRAGLGRCLNAVQILMAQPDSVRKLRPESKLLVAPGCLSTSEPSFRAYGIRDTDIQAAITRLLARAEVRFDTAEGVHISGTSLRDWGLEGLYRKYTDSMVSRVRASRAGTMAIATPKSFETLGKLDFGCRTVTLPSVLAKELGGMFAEADGTVAYHRACAGGGRFDEDCIALLEKIPGLTIAKVEGECGDTGWRDVTSGSRELALKLLRRTEKAGIRTLVTGSTRCSAHLSSVIGGWDTSPVRVVDIYTFMAENLGRDE